MNDAPQTPRGLLEDFLLAGFDPSARSRDFLHRVRTISGSTLGLGGIALFFFAHSVALGLPVQAGALGVGFGMGVLGYLAMRRTGQIAYGGHAIVAALVLVLVSQAFVTGGFENPQFAWFLVVPLLAGATLGQRPGLIWGGVSFVCMFAFWYAWATGVELPNLVPESQRAEAEGLTRLGALLAALTVMMSFLRAQEFAEAALLETNESLRLEVEERTQAEEAAREAARARTDFLATISHEIRTPLNGVMGMTSLLLDTELTEQQRGFAQTARRSGDALLRIINDVLDFSKVDAGKLVIESVDFYVRDAIEDVAELLAESAHAKGIELVAEVRQTVPRKVVGDAGRLRQILLNLVSNAIKFTSTGHVRLAVSYTSDGDRTRGGMGTLRVEVEDTGIGIPAEKQVTLFDPFVQADSTTTRTYGGSGLGLAIVRRLAAAMGGDCGVVSEVGVGSLFWVTMRMANDPNAISRQIRSLGSRALIAVRDPVAGAALQSMLDEWGTGSVIVSGAGDAEVALAEGAYGVAIVDADLTLEGASMAIDAARASNVPIILLMPVAGPFARAPAESSKLSATVRKPPRRGELLDAVTGALAPGRPSLMPPPVSSVPPPELQGRVLVAEDNLVNQQVVRMMLANIGLESDVAANGQEALGMLGRASYAAVLMDCHMPVMDGYEATRVLRAGGDTTPVIALTANAMLGDREKVLAVGMNDYLTKPVTVEALREALSVFCR